MNKKNKNKKDIIKAVLLLGGAMLISLLMYIILIRFYRILFPKAVLFFGACILAVLSSIVTPLVYRKVFKRRNETQEWLENALMIVTCTALLILFAILGPVFIDRSISYHIVFYAAQEESINIDEIREAFSNEIFEKRIEDETTSGMIYLGEDGLYHPTWKSKLAAAVLIPLGEITDTLDTYEDMKDRMKR